MAAAATPAAAAHPGGSGHSGGPGRSFPGTLAAFLSLPPSRGSSRPNWRYASEPPPPPPESIPLYTVVLRAPPPNVRASSYGPSAAQQPADSDARAAAAADRDCADGCACGPAVLGTPVGGSVRADSADGASVTSLASGEPAVQAPEQAPSTTDERMAAAAAAARLARSSADSGQPAAAERRPEHAGAGGIDIAQVGLGFSPAPPQQRSPPPPPPPPPQPQEDSTSFYCCARCAAPAFDEKALIGLPIFRRFQFSAALPGALKSRNIWRPFMESLDCFGICRTELLCAGCGAHLGWRYDHEGPHLPASAGDSGPQRPAVIYSQGGYRETALALPPARAGVRAPRLSIKRRAVCAPPG